MALLGRNAAVVARRYRGSPGTREPQGAKPVPCWTPPDGLDQIPAGRGGPGRRAFGRGLPLPGLAGIALLQDPTLVRGA